MVSQRLIRLGFAVALVVILVLSLVPVPEGIMMFSWQDKIEHAFAFLVLGLLGWAAYPGHARIVLGGLLAYGGLIEIAQGMTAYRMADPADFAADAVGLMLAALSCRFWMRRTI